MFRITYTAVRDEDGTKCQRSSTSITRSWTTGDIYDEADFEKVGDDLSRWTTRGPHITLSLQMGERSLEIGDQIVDALDPHG